jgi:UTP--glucose-1-phosphate uridylyltransferase
MPIESAGQAANFQDVIAVIPAAGLGTRMRPWTRILPKELLPFGRKPMIHHALEEAVVSGIRKIIVVIRKEKAIIRDYIEMLKNQEDEILVGALSGPYSIAIEFVLQAKPLGLGDAIYTCRDEIAGSPFTMIIPDQFLDSDVPASRQLLVDARQNGEAVWSSIVKVPDGLKRYFPGARAFKMTSHSKKNWRIHDIEDIPNHSDKNQLLGFGRTYFPKGVTDYFSSSFVNPRTGEVDLFLSFKALISDIPNYAVCLAGFPMDLGTWEGYEFFTSRRESKFFLKEKNEHYRFVKS